MVLIGTTLFPYLYIHIYLLYGFLLGMATYFLTGAVVSGFVMSLVPYLIYIMVLFFIFWRAIRSTEKINWFLVLLISLFWFIAQLFYFSGWVFIPRQGWLVSQGFASKRFASKHDEKNWWSLNRYTPIYPFQPIGDGLTRDGFGVPKGYLSLGTMDEQNPLTGEWDRYIGSYLIPIPAVPHAFVFGFLHATLFYVFIRRRIRLKA